MSAVPGAPESAHALHSLLPASVPTNGKSISAVRPRTAGSGRLRRGLEPVSVACRTPASQRHPHPNRRTWEHVLMHLKGPCGHD